jgi:hypothetical protein
MPELLAILRELRGSSCHRDEQTPDRVRVGYAELQSRMQVEFTLNGTPRRVEIRHGESLLDVLRERCGILSPKDGCQPQGQCGCCLALIDGHPKVTCAVPADHASGKHIRSGNGIRSSSCLAGTDRTR